MCFLCQYITELDDVVLRHGDRIICLICYERETQSERIMSKDLRRDVIAVLATVPVS